MDKFIILLIKFYSLLLLNFKTMKGKNHKNIAINSFKHLTTHKSVIKLNLNKVKYPIKYYSLKKAKTKYTNNTEKRHSSDLFCKLKFEPSFLNQKQMPKLNTTTNTKTLYNISNIYNKDKNPFINEYSFKNPKKISRILKNKKITNKKINHDLKNPNFNCRYGSSIHLNRKCSSLTQKNTLNNNSFSNGLILTGINDNHSNNSSSNPVKIYRRKIVRMKNYFVSKNNISPETLKNINNINNRIESNLISNISPHNLLKNKIVYRNRKNKKKLRRIENTSSFTRNAYFLEKSNHDFYMNHKSYTKIKLNNSIYFQNLEKLNAKNEEKDNRLINSNKRSIKKYMNKDNNEKTKSDKSSNNNNIISQESCRNTDIVNYRESFGKPNKTNSNIIKENNSINNYTNYDNKPNFIIENNSNNNSNDKNISFSIINNDFAICEKDKENTEDLSDVSIPVITNSNETNNESSSIVVFDLLKNQKQNESKEIKLSEIRKEMISNENIKSNNSNILSLTNLSGFTNFGDISLKNSKKLMENNINKTNKTIQLKKSKKNTCNVLNDHVGYNSKKIVENYVNKICINKKKSFFKRKNTNTVLNKGKANNNKKIKKEKNEKNILEEKNDVKEEITSPTPRINSMFTTPGYSNKKKSRNMLYLNKTNTIYINMTKYILLNNQQNIFFNYKKFKNNNKNHNNDNKNNETSFPAKINLSLFDNNKNKLSNKEKKSHKGCRTQKLVSIPNIVTTFHNKKFLNKKFQKQGLINLTEKKHMKKNLKNKSLKKHHSYSIKKVDFNEHMNSFDILQYNEPKIKYLTKKNSKIDLEITDDKNSNSIINKTHRRTIGNKIILGIKTVKITCINNKNEGINCGATIKNIVKSLK